MNDFSSSAEHILSKTDVKKVFYFPEIESTNTTAISKCSEPDSRAWMPLLVICDRQSQGRGRGTNQWWSADGAITFSIAISKDDLNYSPEQISMIPLVTGYAIAETLANYLDDKLVQIKWPNDVYFQGKKICGILSESANQNQNIVIGCGINANNSMLGAPKEVRENSVSLVDVFQSPIETNELLSAFCQSILNSIGDLKSDANDTINQIRQRCFLTRKLVTIQSGQETFTGLCHGIDDQGCLIIENESDVKSFIAGSILKVSNRA